MIRALCIVLCACALTGCAARRHLATRDTPSPPATTPSPDPAWTTIGRSTRNRPLEARTVGRGPRRVYLIGGIHGDEPEGQAAALAIAANPPPGATLRILKDLNPDGTAARTRTNARGRDLNRNWPAATFRPGNTSGPRALSEPEADALARDLTAFVPDIILVFHSSRSGPFVNHDGPASELAADFADAARSSDPRWRVVPDMGYPTPGSMGSYFGIDKRLPILTIEFRRGQDPDSTLKAARAGIDALTAR